MNRRHLTTFVLIALAAALAACGSPTPPTQPEPEPDVQGSYYDVPGSVEIAALAVGVGVYDHDYVVELSADLKPAALVDTGDGWMLGPVSVVEPDGSIEVDFPAADADLLALLVPAEEAFFLSDPACVVTVSDPAVEMTVTAFELITAPGLMIVTPQGVMPALMTDQPLEGFSDEHAEGVRFFGFTYVTGPVEVTALGAACEAEGMTVDLTLEEGWNWIEWEILYDDLGSFAGVHAKETVPPTEAFVTAPPFL